jgi:hypothetical protein
VISTRKLLPAFLALSLLFSHLALSGCAPLIIGGALGVVGGYAISRDTVVGAADKDYELLWDASLETANSLGIVKKQDRQRGTLQFNIGSSNLVIVSLEKMTAKSTRLKVSARKHRFPDLKTAEAVFIRIMDTVE